MIIARQEDVTPKVLDAYKDIADPRLRARAVWLLAAIKGNAPAAVTQALADQSDDLRAVGLRIARMYSLDVIPVVEKLAKDASPLVRDAAQWAQARLK